MTEPHQADGAVVKTLLLTDLVDSTRWTEKLGDLRAAEVFGRYDRLARDLLREHRGREIDKTDGFFLLFDRPIDAVRYALAHHRGLAELSSELGLELTSRAGVHLGEVVLRENRAEDVARGAKPLEVEGLAKPTAARLMALARGGQTLLTRGAFDLAQRAAAERGKARGDLRWLAHGPYVFKGVEEPVEVFEVGEASIAPLAAPPSSAKAHRFDDGTIPGWRPAPGQVVPQRPHWRLAEKLSEGGFGDVWLAAHGKTGDKRVYKFCYQAAQLRALQREVTVFRLLKETLGERQDIARVLDWNFDEAPYFLELEYTAGGNLAEWAEAQGGLEQVPLATRIELAAQVADALAAAHSVGVLHKDVKPANILITVDLEGRPRACLTDFGISLITDTGRLVERGITVLDFEATAGDFSTSSGGTPLYAAPEVLAGEPGTVQADLYALGVLLYQLVVADLSQILAPGWERDVGDELLREDVAALVDKSPARRPGDAARVAARLRALDARREKRAAERRERREAEAARRALVRSRRRWRLAAAVGVVSILFGVAMLFQARRIAREAERANQEAEAALQVSRFLVDLFEVSDPDVAAGRDTTTREILERGARRIDRDLRSQPLIQARLMDTIGTVYRKTGLYGEAEAMYRKALETRRANLDGGHRDVGASLFSLANLYFFQYRIAEADDYYRQALEVQEADPGPADPQTALTLRGLGRVRRFQGRFDEAEDLLQRALSILQGSYGTDHEEVAITLHLLAILYDQVGRWPEAESLCRRAIQIWDEALGTPEHPDVGWTLNTLGSLAWQDGRHDEAGRIWQRAYEIWAAALGEGHPYLAWSLTSLAEVARVKGRHRQAEDLYRRALAIGETTFGAGHASQVRPLNGLAELYRARGRAGEARDLYERAVAIGGEHPVEAGVDAAASLLGLANLHREAGRAGEAEPLYRRALEAAEAVRGPEHPGLAAFLTPFADFLQATDRAAEARALEARAAALSVG